MGFQSVSQVRMASTFPLGNGLCRGSEAKQGKEVTSVGLGWYRVLKPK